MKTMRAIFGKALWVGRAASTVLELVLALVLGVATTALAGTGVGAAFNLGKTNSVDRLSSLVGSVSGAVLKVDNNGAGTALDLRVGPSAAAPDTKTTPPMRVDSQAEVGNLNAEMVDGHHAGDFYYYGDTVTNSDQLGGQDSTQFWSGKRYLVTQIDGRGTANTNTMATAACDNGDIALGGGYYFDPSDSGYRVTAAYSIDGHYNLYWYSDSTPDDPTVWADCADFPPLR